MGPYFEADGCLHVTVGATANNRGSSVLEVYTNKIVVRVRNHAKQIWNTKLRKEVKTSTSLTPLKRGR